MTDQISLDHPTVDECTRHLFGKHGAFERPKNDAPEMQIVAQALGFAPLFGVNGLPTQDEFLSTYYTTIGPVVYVPRADFGHAPLVRLAVKAHEVQHVVDWYKDPLGFPARYLALFVNADGGQLEPRTIYETSAQAVAMHVQWLFTGELPAFEHLGQELAHGYGVGPAEVKLDAGLLEQAATSLNLGLPITEIGEEVRQWFLARAPNCLHPKARRDPR
jgi:hypothetical protein